MDDETQAVAYANTDFSSSNQCFVDGLVETFGGYLETILDIGCGPADVPIRILRKVPNAHVTAIDASPPMVNLARKAVRNAHLQDHIEILLARLGNLNLQQKQFKSIISKDMLHHLPDPAVFWEQITTRSAQTTAIYVMDLYRPNSPADAQRITDADTSNEPDILRSDFYNSLLAAFTINEIKNQLASAGLKLNIKPITHKHLLISGILTPP